jgi:dTDP-4-amino-4,6-dideoxygalactose transaminase
MKKTTQRLYLSPPHLDGAEKEFLVEALESNWIATVGPHVAAFEREMCEKLGASTAVAVSSGTAALHLALIVLGVKRDDVVFCSDLTFVASANPIVYCGAQPVFIDSERESWNIDPQLLEQALEEHARKGKLPKALVAVDLYGQTADYRRIEEICARYEVPIIEDAAEALGATCLGKSCGTYGRIGVLSFNGNKIMTTSGGGMLVSNDPLLTKKAKHLAMQAVDPVPYYHHTSIGYNYRLSNLLAAIGRAQLKNLDRKVQKRREINEYYREKLADLPGLEFMPEVPYGRSNHWLTCITLDSANNGLTTEGIRVHLEKRNIESRRIWKPMHLQPIYKDCPVFGRGVSEDIFNRGLCLPSGSAMTHHDLDRVVGAIREAVQSAILVGN